MNEDRDPIPPHRRQQVHHRRTKIGLALIVVLAATVVLGTVLMTDRRTSRQQEQPQVIQPDPDPKWHEKVSDHPAPPTLPTPP